MEKNIGVLDKLCPDVNGRYAIEVDFIPDGKVHTISYKIKEFISSKKDGIEVGERLELKSFYGENAKLSIGMEGDAGYYLDGTRASDTYDYDKMYAIMNHIEEPNKLLYF